uniref:branched-chain amino acid ABC transporter permease n=1 Tax=Nonomuraea bangladeshensis TaxID=404385 RepID=UPI003F490909
MQWMNALLQGVLLGGLYALLASGLSLMFGVMRIVNLAHGLLAVAAAYLGLVLVQHGVHPALAVPLVMIVAAPVGYVLQIVLFDRSLALGGLAPLLVAFGLAVVVTQILQEIFTADTRTIQVGSFATASIRLGGGLAIGVFPLVSFAVGAAAIGGLQAFLARTQLGRAMRAASDDVETVRLMGVSSRRVYGMSTALAFATVALAGMFLGMRTQFSPTYGDAVLIFAFEAVIIGGMGSLWGTLAGGIILGVAQTVGAQLDPAYGVIVGHLVFLVVLAAKPGGLIPKVVTA